MSGVLLRAPRQRLIPISVSNLGRFGLGVTGPTGAATWPSSGLCIYTPFSLPGPAIVARLWVINNNATGNIGLGIYGEDQKKIVSVDGQTRTGSNVRQFYDVTDLVIGPGHFFFGCAMTTGSVTRYAPSSVGIARGRGLLQEALGAGVTTLPANMTPAAAANAFVPAQGFTQSASL